MWKIVQLGEICDVLDSLRKPITKKYREEGDYPYYGATGIVDWVQDYIFDEKLVLVGEDGAKWGSGDTTAFIATGKYWVNNHAHVLRPKPELVIHEWISYYLTGIDLSKFVTGLTVPKLNQANLRTIPIPLPPLAEQQRIVAKLDAAFAEIDVLIGLAETEAEELSKLKSSLITRYLNADGASINEAFLGDIIEKTETVNPASAFPNKEFDYVDVSSVNRSSLEIEKTQSLLGKKAPSRARRLIKNNDVIFATIRPTLRRVAIVPDNLNNQICSTGYIVLRPKPDTLLSSFLFYFLISDKVLFEMEQLQSGASYPAVTDSQVKSLSITYPSIAEQQRIVTKLNAALSQLGNAEALTNEKLKNLNLLKSAILAQELQSEAA